MYNFPKQIIMQTSEEGLREGQRRFICLPEYIYIGTFYGMEKDVFARIPANRLVFDESNVVVLRNSTGAPFRVPLRHLEPVFVKVR